MWLENLKELRTASKMTTKQIAEAAHVPERTVARIFSGETESPNVDNLHKIVNALGGSLDDILAGTKAVVGGETLSELQTDVERLTREVAALTAELTALAAENGTLRLKLEHKEELLALHNYYINKNN